MSDQRRTKNALQFERREATSELLNERVQFAQELAQLPPAGQLEAVKPSLPLQLMTAMDTAGRGTQVHEVASAGMQSSASALPHVDAIQASFGRHDVSNVQAHVGGAAASASDALGAKAYASGNQVAFKASPDLSTAAHEAAHEVQQRGGAS